MGLVFCFYTVKNLSGLDKLLLFTCQLNMLNENTVEVEKLIYLF